MDTPCQRGPVGHGGWRVPTACGWLHAGGRESEEHLTPLSIAMQDRM